MKNRSLWESFRAAANGIHLAWMEGSNLRLMALIAYVVLVLASWLAVSAIELALLLLAIALVLVAEMMNTAIEATIDIVVNDYHPLAKKAKDIAAGGVLVASGISLVVGSVVILPHLSDVPSAIGAHLTHGGPVLFLTLAGVAFLTWLWLASLKHRSVVKSSRGGGAVDRDGAVSPGASPGVTAGGRASSNRRGGTGRGGL